MDRESLTALLGQGLSLEKIAARFDKHPSTVAYWMAKYGLEAPNRDKHAAKGGIEEEVLQALIERGCTVREIAVEVDRCTSTVRHWLKRYGLRTRNRVGPRLGKAAVAAKDAGRIELTAVCMVHGETTYVLEGRGYYRCRRCRSEQIRRHRRRLKERLVAEAGGRCQLCGYDRWLGALEFHHLDPATKRLGISAGGLTLSIEAARAEAAKCILLCSNCHAEVEGGARPLRIQLSLSGGEAGIKTPNAPPIEVVAEKPIHHNPG